MNVSSPDMAMESPPMNEPSSAFPKSPVVPPLPDREPPITIRRQRDGKEVIVMTAKKFRKLERDGRRVVNFTDLSEGEIESIRQAKAPPEAALFNHEFDPNAPDDEPGE